MLTNKIALSENKWNIHLDMCFGDAKIQQLPKDQYNKFLFLNKEQAFELLFENTHLCGITHWKHSRQFLLQFGAHDCFLFQLTVVRSIF